jgi:hypothetical protein
MLESEDDPRAHAVYVESLRRLGPEGRLRRCAELSEWTRSLFFAGVRAAHPELSEEEARRLGLKILVDRWNRPSST